MAATDLRQRLMAATATLLGATSIGHTATPPKSADRWTWDTSYTHYKESERISVSEPQIGVRRDFADDRSLSILATVDTISGSTPLGTLPMTANTSPATVTSASGRAVNPNIGRIPLSDMSDTRLTLATTYERPSSESSRSIYTGTASKEHDFISAGASYTRHQEFNQKNTTLSFGVAPEIDIVTPNGGLPYAYGGYQTPTEYERHGKTKYLVGGLLGISQVVNRKTFMQWNYSPTYENGYLNDPYKLISQVNNQGDPVNSIHEKRPGSRLEHSFYWLTRYNFHAQDVFSLGFRYFADDWGIRSSTLDFSYRWHYHEKRFFEPTIRYYHQTSARFFRIGLRNAASLPDFASADYRLNELSAVTFGVRMGWVLKNGSELTLRADYYTQNGESSPRDAIGAQRAYDLFPTLHATILQITYSFEPQKLFHPPR